MKVKVYLQPKGDVFFSEQEKNNNFLTTYFKKIELARVEPDCPFCGMKLKNACCQCLEFANACSGLLAKYEAEAVEVGGGVCVLSCFPLKAENITLSSVVSEDNLPQLFDLGTKVKVWEKIFWVSEGTFDRKILKFYIYHKQLMKVYECRIKVLSYQPRESEVSLCKYVSHMEPYGKSAKVIYGRYRIKEERKTLARFGYTKYLKKIKKMAKKK